MSLVKTEGIVLREVKYGERDKMLTVFTKEYGTVSVSARGVRGGKNRYAGAGLFCYSNFVLYQGRSSYQLNECELIHSFHRVCEDLNAMALASYFCEIVSGEQLENVSLMRLLLNTLSMLEKRKIDLRQIKGVFELRAAGELGFAPNLYSCVRCGAEEHLTRFSGKEGGTLCETCGEGMLPVSTSVLNAMRYVQTAPNPFSFSVSEESLREFSEICQQFLLNHLDKMPKTLDFAKKIIEM